MSLLGLDPHCEQSKYDEKETQRIDEETHSLTDETDEHSCYGGSNQSRPVEEK